MATSNSMIETITGIINSTNEIASKMNDKDRLQVKELAVRVANARGLDPKQVLDFVTYFVRNTDLGYVSRGKNGGFIRGAKPNNTPAPAPSVTDDTSESDDDSDDDSED